MVSCVHCFFFKDQSKHSPLSKQILTSWDQLKKWTYKKDNFLSLTSHPLFFLSLSFFLIYTYIHTYILFGKIFSNYSPPPPKKKLEVLFFFIVWIYDLIFIKLMVEVRLNGRSFFSLFQFFKYIQNFNNFCFQPYLLIYRCIYFFSYKEIPQGKIIIFPNILTKS